MEIHRVERTMIFQRVDMISCIVHFHEEQESRNVWVFVEGISFDPFVGVSQK